MTYLLFCVGCSIWKQDNPKNEEEVKINDRQPVVVCTKLDTADKCINKTYWVTKEK